MPELDIDDFDAFFAAVNDGHRPYAWQRALVARLLDGDWPDQVVAPTGAGKSVFIEAHVFCRAFASIHGTSYPRRLALSVGRRALIDSQAARAQRIADAIAAASDGILAAVRDALGVDAAGDRRPVRVSVLRGGMSIDEGWISDPLGCQILCITPDLLGSRLLFRGYMASRLSRPRPAGLLAYDTVVVVDESHMNTQLVTTLRRISGFAGASPLCEHLAPLRVIETTATPSSDRQRTLDVAGTYTEDPELRDRLTAPKSLGIVTVPQWPLPRDGAVRREGITAVAGRARARRGETVGTVGVVLNRVRDAVDVAQALRDSEGEPTVAVLVGPMRPFDRRQLETRYPGLLTPQGNPDVDFLVATQTVEVGIDLDLHALVSDIAPAAALVQRAGRLNRRGLLSRAPFDVVVPENGSLHEEPLPYTEFDIEASIAWVEEMGEGADISPVGIQQRRVPGSSPRRLLPLRLTRAEAELLSRTTEDLVAEPDLELWLADSFDEEAPGVAIVGRRLPQDRDRADELISLTPPSSQEMYPVPLGTARRVLRSHPRARTVLVRAGSVTEVADITADVKPGDTIVIDADVRASAFGTIPDPRTPGLRPIGDVSPEVDPDPSSLPWRALVRTEHELPQNTPESLLLHEASEAVRAVVEERDEDEGGWTPAPADLLPFLTPPARAGLSELCQEFGMETGIVHLPSGLLEDGSAAWLAITWPERPMPIAEALQEFSPMREPVSLRDHQRDVAERARTWAEALGLPSEVVGVLELAGLHHDDGKAARPFQRRLGWKSGHPLAKSGEARGLAPRARMASGLPPLWRHEQLSVVAAWDSLPAEHRDITARLIGTSHGWGRIAFPLSSADLVTSDMVSLAPSARALFDLGGWDELMESTERAWGLWGTAFLEAILRAADGTVSSEGH